MDRVKDLRDRLNEASRMASFVRTDEIPKKYTDKYPILGRGTTSIVLDKGKTVLMFTRDRVKSDWLQTEKIGTFIERYDSRQAHHIKGMTDFPIEVLELPKLYPLSKENKTKIVKACRDFNHTVISMTKPRGMGASSIYEIGEENWEAFTKSVAPLKIFANLLRFLSNYMESHYSWDVRQANFMQTARGRVVVLDPIVSKELVDLWRESMMTKNRR